MQEGFLVLEGDFSFQHNGKVVNATARSFIHVQRGVVHTYKNIGKDMSRLLVTGIPAGFESFIEELGVPITDEKSFIPPSDIPPPDIGRIVEISIRVAYLNPVRFYGIAFMVPPYPIISSVKISMVTEGIKGINTRTTDIRWYQRKDIGR